MDSLNSSEYANILLLLLGVVKLFDSRFLCSLIRFNNLFFKTFGEIIGFSFGLIFFLVLCEFEDNELKLMLICFVDIIIIIDKTFKDDILPINSL